MMEEYPYPIPDGTECNDCADIHGTGGHFKNEVCNECGVEPHGGPQNDDWIHAAYERQAESREAARRTRSEWITFQAQ